MKEPGSFNLAMDYECDTLSGANKVQEETATKKNAYLSTTDCYESIAVLSDALAKMSENRRCGVIKVWTRNTRAIPKTAQSVDQREWVPR